MMTGFTLGCLNIFLGQAAVLRNVRIHGKRFVLSKTNATIVMGGPNVVVKGPPYMPSVAGDTICNDVVNAECTKSGTCKSCYTFNQADVDHIKSLGWNFIRLGVVWAGAQPRDENALDPEFVHRLHSVLNLTDANGIHVMLDNHGDMVGSQGCGNGVPTWFQLKAAPDLIGKPLTTGLPFSLFPQYSIDTVSGYEYCGKHSPKWAEHAGDPNYNLLNECCLAINSDNPQQTGFTRIAQKTMDYMVKPGAGRGEFVRYWRLMAEAVKDHPSAFAAELMNEPMTLRRKWAFDTWRLTGKAINEVIPDMSIAVADTGQLSSLVPAHSTKLWPFADISEETQEWIKEGNNAFYAWHYGGVPTSIQNMQAISERWNVPTFGTELGCSEFLAAKSAGISHSYWHYSSYCNTGPAFGNKSVPESTFGACILGWDGGDSSACVKPEVVFI